MNRKKRFLGKYINNNYWILNREGCQVAENRELWFTVWEIQQQNNTSNQLLSPPLCQEAANPWSLWIFSTSRQIRVPTPTGSWRKRISEMSPNQLVTGWPVPINIFPTPNFDNAWNVSVVHSAGLYWVPFSPGCQESVWGFSQTRPCLHAADFLVGETDHTSGSQHNQT